MAPGERRCRVSAGRIERQSLWLAALRAPGLTPRQLRHALETCGDIAALVNAPAGQLVALGIPSTALAGLRTPDAAQLASDQAWLAQPGAGLITLEDADYPARLRDLSDAPPALWLLGRRELLSEPQLAIVGSRNPTHDGRDIARAFAAALTKVGLVITSGLARGVDAAAHEGALAAGGDTLAVLGGGLDTIYPADHRDLGERIAASGLLVSEYPPGTPPRRGHFPARNRLISALALGVLVVEAALRSGSLITARLAAEQGREVFAIPGSIHNPMARGCHRLIRDGARLVETCEDILTELQPLLGDLLRPGPQLPSGDEASSAPQHGFEDTDPDYLKLMNAMEFSPQSVDVLAARTGLTPESVSSMLLILELQGAVEARPGGRFAAHRRAP
ncbi:MAG: DNA-processing protein DprA [Gammaproteobacteria bacterium]|nr:DNA-processing protein DprA [Gammaproteobacteria bacterium]